MDDRADLENRCNRKATRGSNPLVSARGSGFPPEEDPPWVGESHPLRLFCNS